MEMALAKADAGIAAHYDRQLVPADQQDLGAMRCARGCGAPSTSCSTSPATAICSKTTRCCAGRSTCAIPYVDPINLLQVELLRRLRAARARTDETEWLRRALLVTINGIAAGMRKRGRSVYLRIRRKPDTAYHCFVRSRRTRAARRASNSGYGRGGAGGTPAALVD